jgi:hypothetical protein
MTVKQLMRYIYELEDLAIQKSWIGKEDADEQEAIKKYCVARRAKIVRKLKDGVRSENISRG